MLLRNTKNSDLISIQAEKEFSFESINSMKTVIPYSAHWSSVLIQVSGGLDSALLLYLTAKLFKSLNSNIQIIPISFDIPYKAKNLKSCRAVIQKVKDLTQYKNISTGIEVEIPLDKCENPMKNLFMKETILEIIFQNNISFEFNGNTKNPPEDVRKFFSDDPDRQLERDERSTIYNNPVSASPHALNDKSGIVYLYKKEGIVEDIAPLTLSCDMNIDVILEERLPVPCHICWWCQERKWGFTVNHLTDPAKPVYIPN